MTLCIVIPTYNESENLRELMVRVESVLHNNSLHGYIIIVDDNSPDGTGEIADQLAKEYGNIIIIHRQAKLGIGSAYRDAFQMILSKLDTDVIFQMDADLSHDPSHIPAMLEKLNEGYDLIVGSRYIRGGSVNNWPVKRKIISKTANFLAGKLTGIKVSDITSGFRAYRTEVLKSVNPGNVKSDGYAFQVEFLSKCFNIGFRIAEYPIRFEERNKGKTKLGKYAILEFIKALASLPHQGDK